MVEPYALTSWTGKVVDEMTAAALCKASKVVGHALYVTQGSYQAMATIPVYSGPYSLGAVEPHVGAAANEIGSRFNIETVYGYNYRTIAGTDVLSDHALGLALDFMTFDGDALAEYARANAARLAVTYVIWNRRIWSVARNSEGWRYYDGVSPHTDHVHVSFANISSDGSGGGAAASAGTHDRGGVVDIAFTSDWFDVVKALRDVGFAAWPRRTWEGPWGDHIHAVLYGHSNLSPEAKDQITSYLNGGDGLAGNGPDTFSYRPNPIPMYIWDGPCEGTPTGGDSGGGGGGGTWDGSFYGECLPVDWAKDVTGSAITDSGGYGTMHYYWIDDTYTAIGPGQTIRLGFYPESPTGLLYDYAGPVKISFVIETDQGSWGDIEVSAGLDSTWNLTTAPTENLGTHAAHGKQQLVFETSVVTKDVITAGQVYPFLQIKGLTPSDGYGWVYILQVRMRVWPADGPGGTWLGGGGNYYWQGTSAGHGMRISHIQPTGYVRNFAEGDLFPIHQAQQVPSDPTPDQGEAMDEGSVRLTQQAQETGAYRFAEALNDGHRVLETDQDVGIDIHESSTIQQLIWWGAGSLLWSAAVVEFVPRPIGGPEAPINGEGGYWPHYDRVQGDAAFVRDPDTAGGVYSTFSKWVGRPVVDHVLDTVDGSGDPNLGAMWGEYQVAEFATPWIDEYLVDEDGSGSFPPRYYREIAPGATNELTVNPKTIRDQGASLTKVETGEATGGAAAALSTFLPFLENAERVAVTWSGNSYLAATGVQVTQTSGRKGQGWSGSIDLNGIRAEHYIPVYEYFMPTMPGGSGGYPGGPGTPGYPTGPGYDPGNPSWPGLGDGWRVQSITGQIVEVRNAWKQYPDVQ